MEPIMALETENLLLEMIVRQVVEERWRVVAGKSFITSIITVTLEFFALFIHFNPTALNKFSVLKPERFKRM